MNKRSIDQNKDTGEDSQSERLMIKGLVQLSEEGGGFPVEITRDMTVLTEDGQEAGQIAAVVVNRPGRMVTHILLGRMGQTPEYRLIPICLIKETVEAKVILTIPYSAIQQLALRSVSEN